MSIPDSYLNPDNPVDKCVADPLSNPTPEDKIGQSLQDSPPNERLGIPAYNWRNECLHGDAWAGIATVFPQAAAMAATFGTDLIHRVAVAVSDEARAKHHANFAAGDHSGFKGLIYWTLNINIFRNPRRGRARKPLASALIRPGDGRFLRSGAPGRLLRLPETRRTAEHFAVHGGPEEARHSFVARVGTKDLRASYLPAFRDCVIEARAESVGAKVQNNGQRAGDQRVQLYPAHESPRVRMPIRQLAGFQRVELNPGEKKKVMFTLTEQRLALIDDEGRLNVEPGAIRFWIGGSQPDPRSIALGAAVPVEGRTWLTGRARTLAL